MAHDEKTKVLITFTKRQMGKAPGETHGMMYKHAKVFVDNGVAVWSKPDDKAPDGFSATDKPHCCQVRTKSVRKKGETLKEGGYSDGGPLKLSKEAKKAVEAAPKNRAVTASTVDK